MSNSKSFYHDIIETLFFFCIASNLVNFKFLSYKNFLSPILLTRSLLPYMSQKTGRVLFASSSTMYTIADLDMKTPLTKYGMDGLGHYAYSKACIAQLVPRLAKTTPIQIHGKLQKKQI